MEYIIVSALITLVVFVIVASIDMIKQLMK